MAPWQFWVLIVVIIACASMIDHTIDKKMGEISQWLGMIYNDKRF